jgi:hypothetical protein
MRLATLSSRGCISGGCLKRPYDDDGDDEQTKILNINFRKTLYYTNCIQK